MKIPFYQTYTLKESAENIAFLTKNPQEISKKTFTKSCQKYFESVYPGYKALLVCSCTRALELIAISMNLTPDDEVILPSFNYVGVGNAFARTGAKLIFSDVDPTTMNAHLDSVKRLVTTKTKVVVTMNYGGISGNLNKIKSFCDEREILFVEDNAQGLEAYLGDKRLGSFGDYSCISFDSLKNISCGEGGVVLYKPKFEDEIQKAYNNGTNRVAFEKGEVDAYEWVSLGSKFVLSEFNAAILLPLLENIKVITQERISNWNNLYDSLWELEEMRPYLPSHMRKAKHNAHIFYLKLNNQGHRDKVMRHMLASGISCSFHYTPLHSSIMGLSKNYLMPQDEHTTEESEKLLRLPIFNELSISQVLEIKKVFKEALLACV